MIHADLVREAVAWLRRGVPPPCYPDGYTYTQSLVRCPVVVSEMMAGGREHPDAIGWHSGYSIIVECKTCRADFRADLQKPFRRSGVGMGIGRYYLTPPGLLTPADLPKRWGLAEVIGARRVRVIRQATAFDPQDVALANEICVLISTLRRLPADVAGVACSFYQAKARKNVASVTIGDDAIGRLL